VSRLELFTVSSCRAPPLLCPRVHIHGEYQTTGTHIHDACDEAESRADYILDTLRALLPPVRGPIPIVVADARVEVKGRKEKKKNKKIRKRKRKEGRKKEREIK